MICIVHHLPQELLHHSLHCVAKNRNIYSISITWSQAGHSVFQTSFLILYYWWPLFSMYLQSVIACLYRSFHCYWQSTRDSQETSTCACSRWCGRRSVKAHISHNALVLSASNYKCQGWNHYRRSIYCLHLLFFIECPNSKCEISALNSVLKKLPQWNKRRTLLSANNTKICDS